MADQSSRSWPEGTPEGIFGVFAEHEALRNGPWLFGEPDAPTIPTTWLIATHWDVDIATSARGDGARVCLSQEELAAPGGAAKKLPKRFDPADLAEPCVEARASIGSWIDACLGEDYENVIAGALELRLGDLPLLASTLARIHDLGHGPDDPLSSALEHRRREILDGGESALALIDLEMLLAHWVEHRNADVTWQRMANASTLSEHALAFAERFTSSLTGANLGPTELTRRRGWGVPKTTLEQLGAERSVTRERMRQIFAISDRRLGARVWPLSAAVESATLQLLQAQSDPLSREPWNLDNEDQGWNEDALIDLLRCLGHKETAETASAALSKRKERPSATSVKAVRKHRDRLGFLDVGILKADTSVAETGYDPIELIRHVYPRVASREGFVLAGTDGATPAERIAGQQFFVTQKLTASELREGIVRVARKRAQPLPPPDRVLAHLLSDVGALDIHSEYVTGPASPLEAGSIQMWLYELVDSSPGGVTHSEDIVRAAIRDQKNISSVMNYVSYEPIVRRFDEGSGLVRLVGRTVKADAAELALRIAAAQRRPSRITIKVSPKSARLKLEVGSSLLKNGNLNLQPEIIAIWPRKGALVTCVCRQKFTGYRRVQSGGLVTGWQTPLAHLVLEHGLQEGGTLILQLKDEILTITDILP